MSTRCPSCGYGATREFHALASIPVNSCLLVDDLTTAREFPRGDLRLAHCPHCGFITNTVFDPSLARYSERYEETQGFSPRFREFARELADHWIDRYDIRHKTVVEIGCGKGEFLQLMCERGDNRGVGIDPSYVPGRLADSSGMTFIRDFYSERYASVQGDVVVCRHTLEHIQPVSDFVTNVRAAIGDRLDTVVLFELPDALRVLEEPAFWDMYYEHCSYFTPGSLARLFRRVGFEVVDLWLDFDDQYILLEARPTRHPTEPALPLEDDLDRIATAVAEFPSRYERVAEGLRRRVTAASGSERSVVVWGAGSKGVAFLTTLDLGDEVSAAVDVNPFKQGKYMAGTGHRIVAPDELKAHPPDTVVLMNGVYEGEVRAQLNELGLRPDVVAL